MSTNFLSVSSSSLSSSQDPNEEISMNFCFLNGVKIKVKGKLDESFSDVFKRFHENQL